jgi:hypothetical protein
VKLEGELFLRAIAFPSTAAFELAYIRKPPPRQGMPSAILSKRASPEQLPLNAAPHSPIQHSTDTQCIENDRPAASTNQNAARPKSLEHEMAREANTKRLLGLAGLDPIARYFTILTVTFGHPGLGAH